jgi:hypothetical protein
MIWLPCGMAMGGSFQTRIKRKVRRRSRGPTRLKGVLRVGVNMRITSQRVWAVEPWKNRENEEWMVGQRPWILL